MLDGNLLFRDVATWWGAVTGTVGCLLGILNFRRDKAKVTVRLSWDLEPWGNISLDQNKLYGCITVANAGRRPIFLSHVALKLLDGKYRILYQGFPGETLKEGDLPKKYLVFQEGLEAYSKDWRKIRGYVEDGSGKSYYSKLAFKRPSWAKKWKGGQAG